MNEDEFDSNIETIKSINKKIDEKFNFSDIDEYINECNIIKKKYSKLKKQIEKIFLTYYEKSEEENSIIYYLSTLKDLIKELDDENKILKHEIKKIKDEVVEIFSNCDETIKDNISDSLKFLKEKLHYNFSLFNIIYISCYIIFYCYFYYNYNDFNDSFIILLFLLFIFYIHNLFK
jgi:predicted  nucleic acid-binding Zn-ribbon protein